MNATSLYVSASRLLFQSDTEHANYTDLYRLVPYLRQSLSCTVCANLLVEPYSPQDMCQHHVCRGCIGGRKNLKPTCVSCKNYQCYQPNSQMRILLQCYKNLCKYILATPAVYDSMHRYVHVEASSNSGTDAHNLAELIDEGAQFHDDYKSNAGLKKAAFSILPFIFSSTAAAASAHNSAATVTSPPAPTITTTTNAARIAIAAVPSTSIATSIAAGDKATFLRSVSHAPIISTANRVLVSTAPPDRGDTITVMANANMLKGQAIKTVSNGSAMYSVLYSGAGNKITIKRKPDDVKTMAAPSSVALASGIGLTPTITTATLSATNMINLLNMNPPKIQQLPVQPQIALQQLQPIVPQQFQISVSAERKGSFKSPPNSFGVILIWNFCFIGQQQQVPTMMSAQHQNFKKPIILTPTLQNTKLVQAKRKGCRCGNATPTPGKLTCCGQRCPCYVESKSCVDCKCRGCRNPHRIDGQKVRWTFFRANQREILHKSPCSLYVSNPP